MLLAHEYYYDRLNRAGLTQGGDNRFLLVGVGV